jgi:hypothetical protein
MFLPMAPGTPKPEINRSHPGVRRKYPIDKMDVGASFFVPDRTCKSVSSYISRIAKDFPGQRFSTRPCHAIKNDNHWTIVSADTRGATEGVGVWRDK